MIVLSLGLGLILMFYIFYIICEPKGKEGFKIKRNNHKVKFVPDKNIIIEYEDSRLNCAINEND